MSASTKERILNAAEEIMLAKSFHSVGLNEILAAVKVPKGSFYHYFESKEQFGVELVRHYVREHSARLRRILGASELNPFERLLALFQGLISRVMEGECKQACLVAKLGAEVSTFSEPMREALREGIRDWRKVYEETIVEGQSSGVIRQDLDPAVTAGLIFDLWRGAMDRAQLDRTVAPLKDAAAFIQGYLRP